MNKIKYEKRMKELDQIAEEQQLRQQVRDRERELGLRRTRKKPAWGKAMMAVYLIALVLLSWLASMVGYDKVIQAIAQLKKTDNNTQGGR